MSDAGSAEVEVVVETVLEVKSIESSEDPPMKQWSSLILDEAEVNTKKVAYEQGLYSPGSGELCAKYIPMSDSSILRHPYYNYAAILDPGINEALLEPPVPVVYPDDGQETYLAACKEMDQCVVNLFYKNLLGSTMNLNYYCVDPQGVRAMGKALKYNKTVKTFSLVDNFLSPDSCYHLGEMLKSNVTLYELNLEGCRIGPDGAKQLFSGLEGNMTLMILNINRNALSDVGGVYFAEAIEKGLNVKQVYIKYNALGSKTAVALAEVLEFYNNFSHLDFSFNNFFSPIGALKMLSSFQENVSLEELDLSWNSLTGPKFAVAIKIAMLAPNLQILKLSNNYFSGEAIEILVENMTKAKKLHTLDLSYNPLTVDDAFLVINKMRSVACKIKNLFLDNIDVDNKFLLVLDRIKRMKSKKDAEITFGTVISAVKYTGPDPRETVLNRIEFLTQSSKRNKIDIGPIILQLAKGNQMMEHRAFQTELRDAGATMLDDGLIETLVDIFAGPKSKKAKLINVKLLADYVKRKWPDAKLPPTPPPTLAPAPPAGDQKKEKGKKK